jgi:HEAT repeat protein
MTTLAETRGYKTVEPRSVADALTRRQQSSKPGHLVLLGEPGDGKTTLLHKLLLYYARHGQFPLFVRSFEWEKINTLEDWIESGGYLQGKGTPEAFGPLLLQYVREGKAPVLLDGLDEVDKRGQVVDKIQDFAAGAGQHTILLVTCRTAVYRNALSSFEALELYPLERYEIEQYVKTRLKERADECLAQIAGDPATRALAGNGLMLAMMSDLYARGRVQLPTSKDELYDQIVNIFLDDPQNQDRPLRHPKVYPLALKRAALEEVAFHTYFCCQRQQEVQDRYVLTVLRRLTATQDWRSYRGQEDDLLKDILLNSGLLFQRGLGEPIRFFHPTLQEYFAARFAVTQWSNDDSAWRDWLPNREHWQWNEAKTFACSQGCENPLPTFAVMVTQPEYREVLLLLSGMLEDRTKVEVFLRGLADELPFLYGLREPNHIPQHYKVWFVKAHEDQHAAPSPNDTETSSPLACEPALPGYVERMVLCDRIQTHLQFALHALCRCQYVFPNLLHNVLQGLEAVSWQQFTGKSNDEALAVLGQARMQATRWEAVRQYLAQLQEQNAPVWIRATAAQALGSIADVHAVDALIQTLTDSQTEAWVRRDAAWALGEIGDDRAAEALLQVLIAPQAEALSQGVQSEEDEVHTREDVRRAAVWALEKIGSACAVEALCKIMKDPLASEEIRSDVAKALGNMRHAHAAEALFQMIIDPLADKIIRRSAAEALARIGDNRAAEALPQVFTELQNDTDAVALALTLGERGNTRAIDMLCQIVLDPHIGEELRGHVAWSLYAIPDDRVINALSQVVTDPQVEAVVRINAGWALSRTTDTRAMDALVQVLTDPQTEAWVRKNAASALAQGGEHTINPLYRVMTDPQIEEQIHRLAAWALGMAGDPRAEPLLFLEMTEPQIEVWDRYYAAIALGNIGDARAVDILLQALADPQVEARLPPWFPYTAVQILSKIGDARAVEALVQVMTSPQVKEVTRAAAARALGAMHSARAVETLLQVLTDREVGAQIRTDAAEALGEIGDDRTVEALFQVLTDLQADATVRRAAIEALGKIGNNCAIDALKAFAENESVPEWARAKAVQTLLEQCEPR